jgi:hypothetical protein
MVARSRANMTLGNGAIIVEVRRPTWRLRGPCPVCGQGSCLAFFSCPSCARLVVICEEEESVFLDPRNLFAEAGVASDEALCPACGQRRLAEFVAASDTTIRSAGFTSSDYE